MRDNTWLGYPPSYRQQIIEPLERGAGVCLFLASDHDGRTLVRCEYEHPPSLHPAAAHTLHAIRARYAIHCQREARKLAASNGCIPVIA